MYNENVHEIDPRKSGSANLRYGKGRAPLFLEDVKANTAIAVNVRVEHLGAEWDLQNTEHQKPTNDCRIKENGVIFEVSKISH
jgi:hypothetical protein